MELKERIAKILLDEKITVVDFSTSIGVLQSNIYKVTRGETKKIQLKTAKKINSVYPKYSIDWILNGVNKNSLVPEINLSEKDTKHLNQIAQFIESNEFDLMQVPTFRLWLKTKIQEGVIEVLTKGK